MGARNGARLMKRTKTLNPGKGFARKAPPRVKAEVRPSSLKPSPCRMFDGAATTRVEVPKDKPLQHEAYMAAVRKLPCALCGWYQPGGIQFAHADVTGRGGKAMGLKSDCRLGWPGCGPHDGLPGCHWIVGTSGRMQRAERRAFELGAGIKTRAIVEAMGAWPKNLPKWESEAKL